MQIATSGAPGERLGQPTRRDPRELAVTSRAVAQPRAQAERARRRAGRGAIRARPQKPLR